MNKFLAKTLQGDRVVWTIFALFFFVSMVEMYSASINLVYNSASVIDPILRHVMFYAVGFVGLLIVQIVDFKIIRMAGYFGLFCSLAMLVFTMLGFGVEQANAARWIEIGGFQFQPSEFAKLSLIVVVADIIERFQNEVLQAKYYWWLATIVMAVCGLIFLENFSTAALLFAVVMLMMWIGEIKSKRILATLGVVVGFVAIVLVIAMVIPEDVYYQSDSKALKLFERAYTWVARIENFAGNDAETVNKFKITDSNYQENHAQMAIARGGLVPRPGTSVESNYLPEAFSDFIFAIIVEELGAIVAILIILFYLMLLFRAGKVARQSDSLFAAILVIGVTMMIVMQAFIHVGVSVHLGPVTGQPLPLISRGGTSILINCIYFGLIINITRYIQQQQMVMQMTPKKEEAPTNESLTESVVETSSESNVEEIKEL